MPRTADSGTGDFGARPAAWCTFDPTGRGPDPRDPRGTRLGVAVGFGLLGGAHRARFADVIVAALLITLRAGPVAGAAQPCGTPITTEKLSELDAGRWELYHVDEDFAATRDLAAEHRDKLIEMIALWYVEAGTTPDYHSPFPSTGTLHSATIDLSGELITDAESEMRRHLARQ